MAQLDRATSQLDRMEAILNEQNGRIDRTEPSQDAIVALVNVNVSLLRNVNDSILGVQAEIRGVNESIRGVNESILAVNETLREIRELLRNGRSSS